MNTVSPLEAARVRAVLEDALQKLSFLSIVTPDVLGHRDEMAALVGDEISQTIKSQREMEAQYDALVQQAASLKGHTNKAKLREVQAQLRAVSIQMRDGMRGLCRSLKENPDVADNLAKLAEERDAVYHTLETAYHELQDGHFHSLAEHVRAATEGRERVSAVAQKEEATTRDVARLTATLKEEEDKHTVELETKRADITTLKEKLRKLKQDTTATIRYARKEITSKTDSNSRLYSSEEQVIADAVAAMRARIADEAAAHEASIDLLRREQEELTRAAEAWKARHAAEVATMAGELKVLAARRDAARVELVALQLRYERDLQTMTEKEVRGVSRCRSVGTASSPPPRSAKLTLCPPRPFPPPPRRRPRRSACPWRRPSQGRGWRGRGRPRRGSSRSSGPCSSRCWARGSSRRRQTGRERARRSERWDCG